MYITHASPALNGRVNVRVRHMGVCACVFVCGNNCLLNIVADTVELIN